MNLEYVTIILEIITILQATSYVQNSTVHSKKTQTIRIIGDALENEFAQNMKRVCRHRNRWRSRRRPDVYFSAWTPWSQCNSECKKQRERYCKVKRVCGYIKHVEENRCRRCKQKLQNPGTFQFRSNMPTGYPIVNINHIQTPIMLEGSRKYRKISSAINDFYVLKTPKKGIIQKIQTPPLLDYGEPINLRYDEADNDGTYMNVFYNHKKKKRNLVSHSDAFEYEDEFNMNDFNYSDTSDYEDYDTEYIDSELEYRNLTQLVPKEKTVGDRHQRIYSKWSKWTRCTPKCTTRRYKKCKIKEQCGRKVLRETAYCYTKGSFCQQWVQAQFQKSQPYEIRLVTSRRKDALGLHNSIASDFIISSKGYRGPEYTPMKLMCGIAPIKSLKRNVYNMLKIIGGKAARKGEWPWQVAIFNRFKEAFCGGTLIAPQWVLTAAHCVRKVLFVRLGEHNLDHEDGTELQFRITKSIKHPNFDKKTVDSDIALLRLPKFVNTTAWVGFSCLPRPFQPLPKNMDCTVIGWGKRRNRDQSGTSILHQAEVPIIPMDNCRSVYYDYTITKNMFCAGHKRGRIDTCAGDSGGPLLCRDSTKPNHPWTIFGITSFGDGCAKRNKFGIYAKVPNYVDWIWSVINCNGNCKQRI